MNLRAFRMNARCVTAVLVVAGPTVAGGVTIRVDAICAAIG